MGANESKEVNDQIEDEQIRAKFQVSVLWLLTKALQGNVTADQKHLFYEDMEGAWYIKPQLMNRLTSGELYCAACANIFQESPSKWQGHSAVIQTLSRKGIYVVEDDGETTVTETVLMQTAPFRISAHLAMIDSIMKAYMSHIVSIEKVVQAVRKFATVSASSELPFDIEDAMLFWINKSCTTVKRRLEKEQKKTEVAKTSEESGLPSIPLMDDLLKDIGDGSAMATLISFYCPNCLKLEDICLKPYLAIADSLYNIQLVKKFCDSNLPRPVFHFSYNDMMYTSEILKTNVVAFFAELFFMFEVNKVDCVTGPVLKVAESPVTVDDAGRPISAKKPAIPPISDVTKRSFQRPAEMSKVSSDPEISKTSNNLPSRQQHLLPKRQQTASDGDEPSQKHNPGAQHSRAWEERRSPEKPTASDVKHRTYTKAQLRKIATESGIADSTDTQNSDGSSLLTNVSLDSDLMESASFSFSDTETPRDSTGSSPPNVTDPSHPDYMELQSVTSQAGSARSDLSQRPTGFTEPLMPAKLKVAKEKNNCSHPKDVESGEAVKRSPGSPSKPVGKVNGSPKRVAQLRQVESDSSSDEEFMTPQASQPNTPFGGSPEHSDSYPAKVAPKKMQQKAMTPPKSDTAAPVEQPLAQTQNAAFFIDTENGTERPIKSKEPSKQASPLNLRRGAPVSQSFVKTDRPLTADLARKVGIPVIGDSDLQAGRLFENVPRRDSEGHSSSDFSDHESSKIHRDHKLRESNDMEGSFYLPPRTESSDTPRPDSLFGRDKETEQKALSEVQVNDTKPSPTTSFAALKKQREQVPVLPPEVAVYHTEIADEPVTVPSLKSQFQRSKEESKPVKKTSFAALPNQTTWQESAQKSAQKMKDMNKENEAGAVQPLASEISSIRLKLEAKRRNIELEKKKIEVQWSKQRQRLGKAAFLHVVSKGKGDKIGSIEEEKEEGRPRVAPVTLEQKPQPRESHTHKKPEEAPKREEVQRQDEPKRDALSKRRDSEPVRQRTPPPQSRPRSATPPHTEVPPRSRTPVHGRTEPAGEEKSRRDSNRSTPPPHPATDAEPEGKKYSTEEIKSTIDNVRQRWFPDNSPVHAPKDPGDKPFQPPNEENANDYGNSLEKLNMSLNDLQGEIMKLTLQQEQITKTISTTGTPKSSRESSADPQPAAIPPVTSAPPTTQTPTPHVPPPPPSQSQDPYYSQTGKPQPQVQGDPYANFPHQNPYMMHPQGPYGSQEFRYGMPYPLNTSQQGYMQYPPGVPPPGTHGVPPHGGPHMQQYQQQQAMYQHLYGQHPGVRPNYPGQSPYITSTQSTLPQSYLQNVSSPSSQYGTSSYQPYSSTHTTNSNINLPLTQSGHPVSLTGLSPSHSNNTTTTTAYQRSSPQSPVSLSHSKSSPSHYQTEPVSDYSRATDGYNSMTSSRMSVSGTGSFHSTGSDAPATTYVPSPTTSLPKQSPAESPVNTNKQVPSSDYNINYQEYKANMDRNYRVESPVDNRSPVNETQAPPEPSPEVELPSDMNVEETGSGFYISFGDTETPKKPKPKLRQKVRKEKEEEAHEVPPAPKPVQPVVPQPVASEASPPQEPHMPRHQDIPNASYTVPVDTPKRSPRQDQDLAVTAKSSPPGVGFVIGQDEAIMRESDELAIQKRKERVMQLQIKRQMEQEKKKAKMEKEGAKKRDEQRLKEELAETKKAEEKAKREQIFQAYLARKAAEEEEERGGPPAREPQKPKAKHKPGKSRPGPAAVRATAAALGGGEDKKSISSASLSSQEDYQGRSDSPPLSHIPGPGIRKMRKGSSPAVIHSLYTKDDTQSSGSLTHRRGDSPGGSGSRLYRSQSENRKGFTRGMNHSDHSDTGSNLSVDYTGPKLYVKPKSMSNRSVIQNAIAYCCLAGTVNNDLKNKTLEQLELCDANHFLVLFRDASCKFRALYQYNPDTEEVYKVSGTGPKVITPKMLDRFYKYNSGSKSFSQITSTKHLSVSIDAITIQSSLWQTKKPPGPTPAAARRPPPR